MSAWRMLQRSEPLRVSVTEESVVKLSGMRRVMDKSAACMDEHMGMESSSVTEILPKRKRR